MRTIWAILILWIIGAVASGISVALCQGKENADKVGCILRNISIVSILSFLISLYILFTSKTSCPSA